jgi:hypothetical protein
MRRFILTCILALAALSPARATDSGIVENSRQGTIVIKDDHGGGVEDHAKFYNRIRLAHIPVRVEGYCNSACTFVLAMPPSEVCVTPKASFGFHLATIDGIPSRKLTNLLIHRSYPDVVKTWIRRHEPLQPEMTSMLADEAIELGIVRRCDEEWGGARGNE